MSEIAQKAIISYERKPKSLHSFFALKFHDGDEDRAKVEAIESALNKAGIEIGSTIIPMVLTDNGNVYATVNISNGQWVNFSCIGYKA